MQHAFGQEHRAEVIMHSALAKYSSDAEFTMKMEKINMLEQKKMASMLEG